MFCKILADVYSQRNLLPFSELDTNVLKLYLGGATICKRLMQITSKSCDNLFAVLCSQLHAWLLFYALPVLREILPSPYFDHLCYLVVSIISYYLIISLLQVFLMHIVSNQDVFQEFHSCMVSVYFCNYLP